MMKPRIALPLVVIIISFCGFLQYRSNINFDAFANAPKSNSESPELYSNAGSEFNYVRHCITGRILGKSARELETVPFVVEGTSPEVDGKRQSDFEDIFKNKVWIPGEQRKNENQFSGPGSTLNYAQEVIAALHSIISQLKRELRVDRIRLLDIPCGDMVWMSRFLKTRDDVQYTGFDIVPDLIERHRKNYVGQSNWTFRVQDIVRDGLNESYDLILSRMMLQHLFSHDALTVIKHFSQSGSRYLLTTTFSRAGQNQELPGSAGRFRMLNLELPPFSLTPPTCVSRDGEISAGEHHFLGLWQLPVRRAKQCNSKATFKVPGFGGYFFSCTNWS